MPWIYGKPYPHRLRCNTGQIHTSSHQLEIETSRYRVVTPKQRTCCAMQCRSLGSTTYAPAQFIMRSTGTSTASLGRNLNHSPKSWASIIQNVWCYFYCTSVNLESLSRRVDGQQGLYSGRFRHRQKGYCLIKQCIGLRLGFWGCILSLSDIKHNSQAVHSRGHWCHMTLSYETVHGLIH